MGNTRMWPLLPGGGVGVDVVGACAGVDDLAEPGGQAGSDTVVEGGIAWIGFKHAAQADLHLPGQGKV